MGSSESILMNSNTEIPQLALGTYNIAKEEILNIIESALSIDYRHIDYACLYENEKEIEENKLRCLLHKFERVRQQCVITINDLQCQYLDLFLIHWSFVFDPQNNKEYQLNVDDIDFVETWKATKLFVDEGLVKSIGLSNFNEEQIERILQICKYNEIHPYCPQILLETYAPLEQGNSSGFQQRKVTNENDPNNGQRTTIKGVLTCTIATILNAKYSESDNCFINKHFKFNTVMIMGLIHDTNHEVSGSLATYNIEDHSGGLLEIKWWHDDSNQSLKPFTYIKVVGQVKIFSGKTHVVAHHISKMQTLNELIAHSLECIHASMFIRKQEQMINGTNNNIQKTSTTTISNGFTPIQNAVLQFLKPVTSMTGCSVTEICKQLKQFTEFQVKQALEFLTGEGHIYSTTDDDHFRAANN
ncbi:unnamed protein product [Adineta steineri]|uniref:Uncharacterized protein n=1 Tax=Adineta steineri TaxID=433720 RepID=A0A818QWT8_9BILA|nr:unnamed protein product [Adineta steineri]